MGILLIVVLAQIVVIVIIVIILKTLLDRKLIELAIRHLAFGKIEKESAVIKHLRVVSFPSLNQTHQEQIAQAIKKQFGSADNVNFSVDSRIMGGIIIKVNEKIIDCSLRNRLQEAFGRKV